MYELLIKMIGNTTNYSRTEGISNKKHRSYQCNAWCKYLFKIKIEINTSNKICQYKKYRGVPKWEICQYKKYYALKSIL